MTAKEVLTKLEKLGKPQTAAIYKRHGAGDNVYGVLTSDMSKVLKQIKGDHAFAMELWRTGNTEARVIALQIADPAIITRTQADAFVKDGSIRFLDTYLSALLARSPIADKTMRAWMGSADESFREMGYSLLAHRLRQDAASVSDADAAAIVTTIEKEIHRSPNWARRSMNSALIAIGVYKPALRKKAVEAAKRIGHVEVDHGETNCKTPDAAAYIDKAAKRKR